MNIHSVHIRPLLLAAALLAPLLTGAASAQTTDIPSCRSAKFKLLGKYEACVWKAQATAEVKGVAADLTGCVSKLDETWTKPNDKFGDACPTSSAASIRGLLDGSINSVKNALVVVGPAVCGNGILDAGEHCDGSAGSLYTDCYFWGFEAGTTLCTASCEADPSNCPSGCDVLTQAGCHWEQLGDACYVTVSNTNHCWPVSDSAGPPGSPCTRNSDCERMSGCFFYDDVLQCLSYCDLRAPACPSGTVCNEQYDPGTENQFVGLCY